MPIHEDGWSGRTTISYGTWTGEPYHKWAKREFPERTLVGKVRKLFTGSPVKRKK